MSELHQRTAEDCLDQLWHVALNENVPSFKHTRTHTCKYAHGKSRETFYDMINCQW